MKNKLLSTLYIALFSVCFIYASSRVSQDSPTTWQEQLEFAKNKIYEENEGDVHHLRLVNYIYKGVIRHQNEKDDIIDSLFSCNAPYVHNLTPIIMRDTTITSDSYAIHQKSFPRFEIITVGKMIELSGTMEVNPLKQIRQQITQLIQVGFEYLELEWSYKGDKFNTICIVSNENGGIVYEPIGNNIHVGTGEECSKVTDLR